MPSFQELRAAVLDPIRDHFHDDSANGPRNAVMANRHVEAEFDRQWRRYIANAIAGRGGLLPDNPDRSPVEFSESCFATLSGAGAVIFLREAITLDRKTFRVSRELAAATQSLPDFGKGVFVELDGEIVALTVPEAFKRALREVPLPLP